MEIYISFYYFHFRKKAVKQFLFFDINSLVIHYMKRLELLKKEEV